MILPVVAQLARLLVALRGLLLARYAGIELVVVLSFKPIVVALSSMGKRRVTGLALIV